VNDQSHPMALQVGYELHWYRVEGVLGQGAFGITYLAHDINLDRQVAIKEYLPAQFAVRNNDRSVGPTTDQHIEDFEWGLKRFIREAKILTKFEHPNLVRVFNVFEMNNTAYMVMNYEVGKSLQQILKSRKTLNETELMKMIIPLLSGLETMHVKGFVHRDIKPGNIFIRRDGSPVLLDFGSARQTRAERGNEMSSEQETVTTLVSPGYAPIEQYSSNSIRQGPWTDIYGLGATIYKAATGKMPLAAVDRNETIMHDKKDGYQSVSFLAEGLYTEKFLAAVDHAMAFKADGRPQNVVEWRTEFGVQEDEILTMPVSNYQAISGGDATVKLDQTQDTVTLKEIGEGQEDTDIFDITDIANDSKPIYLQTKWIATAAVIVVLTVFGISTLPGEKEEEPSPGDQVLAESDQVVEKEVPDTEESAALIPEEQAKIDELLILAEEDIAALRLSRPKDNNALNKYESILLIDENNAKANEGIRLVFDKYISLAYGAMQSNKLDKAGKYIDKAENIYTDSEKIAPARSALLAKNAEQGTTEVEQVVEEPAEDIQQTAAVEDEESGGLWDDFKNWNEKNKNADYEESEADRNVRGHFK